MADQVFSDRYELVRLIARGGMAEVYLARDQRLDRSVAVKVLSAEFARDPSFVARFRREAQAAANLNHPNIVSIFDWGQEEGTYFIVMEYVEGQSLRDLLRDRGPLPAGEAADLGAEIAAALAYAHKHGVVHRDVKPGNVLLTADRQVKVTDLGIALADTSEALTQTGSVMGTATYFSPEQAQGKTVDGRSDVYSLGVVLYEMVTGAPPFTGENPVSVAYQHVREDPVPPSQRATGVSADFERIVLTALAKEPELRYPTADDLRSDLLRFERGQSPEGAAVTAMIAGVGTAATTMANPAVDDTGTAVAAPVPPPEEKKKRRGAVIAAVAAAVVLLAIVLAVLLTGRDDGASAAQVRVPDVVGDQFDDARAELEDEGFEVERVDVQSDLPVGEVVGQNPGEGTLHDEGSNVTLRVSRGVGTVEIPDVSNETLSDAVLILREEGLTPGEKIEQESGDVDPDRVLGTDPPVGTTVERGSTVDIIVAVEPSVVVPEVVGLTEAEAANRLGQNGLDTTTRTEPSETMEAGRVIRTDPPQGARIPPGSTVTIFVSSGPQQVAVPNVVNQSQQEATAALQAAGFVVNAVPVASPPQNEGTVVAQSPAANSSATRGSTVTISVGDGSQGNGNGGNGNGGNGND